jgi:hypothetical protein
MDIEVIVIFLFIFILSLVVASAFCTFKDYEDTNNDK